MLDGGEPVMDPIPEVGEHTGRILAELGYNEDGISALRQDKTV
jgi:formyl-CoA transferase